MVKVSSKLKRLLIGTTGVFVSVIALVYVFYDVDFDKLFACKDRIRWIPLFASVFTYWGCLIVFRSFLVKFFLSNAGKVKFTRVYRCIGIGHLVNNVLPLRMGDLVRSGAIAKDSKLGFSTVMGSMALERMLDMLMVALVAFLAIQMAPVPKEIRIAAMISAIVILVIFVVLILLVRKKQTEIEKNSKNSIIAFVWNLWVRFSSGFSVLGSFRGVVIILTLCVTMWICALAGMMFRLAAFDLPHSISHGLVLLTCLGFGVAIPSAPGYVGVYHAAAALALGIFGIDPVVAAAFGLFSWVIDVSAGNVAGVIGMWFEGMKLGDIKRGDYS